MLLKRVLAPPIDSALFEPSTVTSGLRRTTSRGSRLTDGNAWISAALTTVRFEVDRGTGELDTSITSSCRWSSRSTSRVRLACRKMPFSSDDLNPTRVAVTWYGPPIWSWVNANDPSSLVSEVCSTPLASLTSLTSTPAIVPWSSALLTVPRTVAVVSCANASVDSQHRMSPTRGVMIAKRNPGRRTRMCNDPFVGARNLGGGHGELQCLWGTTSSCHQQVMGVAQNCGFQVICAAPSGSLRVLSMIPAEGEARLSAAANRSARRSWKTAASPSGLGCSLAIICNPRQELQ